MIRSEILTVTQKIGKQNLDMHPVIIFDDSDLVLCDSGCPGQADQINEELLI